VPYLASNDRIALNIQKQLVRIPLEKGFFEHGAPMGGLAAPLMLWAAWLPLLTLPLCGGLSLVYATLLVQRLSSISPG